MATFGKKVIDTGVKLKKLVQSWNKGKLTINATKGLAEMNKESRGSNNAYC